MQIIGREVIMRDNKNILLILLVLSFLLSLLTIFVVAEGGVPSVSAKSATLYEPTSGRFIYEKNVDCRLPMASTTKIMTALIAIERCSLDEVVTVPKEATGVEGSSIYLKEGDTLTVKDLIYSVLLQSANDAATALALLISGDVQSFAALMNDRADEIGLTDTHFENPHGLDSEEHFTTARDLAILASIALENDFFRTVTSTYKYTFPLGDATRTVVNHNKLLKKRDGVVGVKTGYTDRSGRCLVSAIESRGMRFIAVTLDAPDDWNDHLKLLKLGENSFEPIDLFSLTAREFNVTVKNGETDRVIAKLRDNKVLAHEIGSEPYTVSVSLPDFIEAPIKADDVLGELSVLYGDKTIYTTPIVADRSVAKKQTKLFDFLKNLF